MDIKICSERERERDRDRQSDRQREGEKRCRESRDVQDVDIENYICMQRGRYRQADNKEREGERGPDENEYAATAFVAAIVVVIATAIAIDVRCCHRRC